jgi:hypothetical protein
MGYDRKMINKVYILLHPENIDRAIDYMSEINGIFQHNFFENYNSNKDKDICFICKKNKIFHLDYIPDEVYYSNKSLSFNNNINNNISNNLFEIPPLIKKQQFNFDNLSKEEKMEQIEKILHSILSEASSLKEKGNEFYKNNNFEEAEKQYREGINKLNELPLLPDIDELNGQINNYLININNLTIQLHNNLSAAFIKQEKFDDAIKNCEFILQNLNQEHLVSYYRILFCLIALKKVIMANHYAEIIKIKFAKHNNFSKFDDQFAKLEELNKEFSDKILNQNPELKKEVISMNDNMNLKNENEIKKEEDNNIFTNYIGNYIPYIIGGAAILFAGASFLYRKYKK